MNRRLSKRINKKALDISTEWLKTVLPDSEIEKITKKDITTKNPKKFERYHKNFEDVREKIKEVEERDHVRNFQPPISGEEIMKTFNLKPCREIGQLKEAIKEAILEGEIPNNHQASFDFMLQKGEELGLKID